MQQQEQKKDNSLNVLAAIVGGWALTIYVWMRKDIGRNHVGKNGLVGMLWILIWVAYTKVDGVFWLIPMFVIGQVLHQIGHMKPRPIHSRYGGEPIVAMKLLRIKNEVLAKRFGEPLISFAVGMGLILYGYDEGKYFAFGAVALLVNQTLLDLQEKRRVDDIRDGMIEGRHYMNRARE